VQTPLYQSSSTLYVGKKDALSTEQGYNDVMLGNQLVKDYRELILSRTVATKVLTDLKITYLNADQLSSKITVSLKNDTRVIEISATDHDKDLAKKIADGVATVFKDKVFEIMQVKNVNVIDTAEIAKSPISPNKRLNIIVSIMLGLILGIGMNFLIEYLDNTIKTPDDIKKYLDLPVIGVIPIIYD
jgi:capsular polysaccharide biosynthesis protein